MLGLVTAIPDPEAQETTEFRISFLKTDENCDHFQICTDLPFVFFIVNEMYGDVDNILESWPYLKIPYGSLLVGLIISISQRRILNSIYIYPWISRDF